MKKCTFICIIQYVCSIVVHNGPGCWLCISHCAGRSISFPQCQTSHITHCMKNVFWCWRLFALWMELAAPSFSWEGRTSRRGEEDKKTTEEKGGGGGLVRRKDERKSKWWKMSSEFICNWGGLHYKHLADSCQYSAYFSVLTSSIKLEKIISLETER